MMGADSVAYHRDTVLNRADDHPGQALAYYASRGETPLVWGGAGARALGLVGNVTEAQYETLFGPGGAVDPTTGERLVTGGARTTRQTVEEAIPVLPFFFLVGTPVVREEAWPWLRR